MPKTAHFADTNLIVRLLTGEPEQQAKQALAYFREADTGKRRITILPLVVAEAVYVLTGTIYFHSRERVADTLTTFLSNPALIVPDRELVLQALQLFKGKHVDFADAYLAAIAKQQQGYVASFDKDCSRLYAGRHYHPAQG